MKASMRGFVVGLIFVGLLAARYAGAADLRLSVFHTKADAYTAVEDKWIDAVAKATQGRVNFKVAYAGTLFTATEVFDAVQNGALEAGLTFGSLLSGKMPDMSPFEAVGGPLYGGPRYAAMVAEMEPILESIIGQQDVVYLWGFAAPGVTNMCRNKHMKLPADYKGTKVRASGRWQSRQMQVMGGTPVVLDTGAQYQGLQTGTIDCTLINNTVAMSMKLNEPAKFITEYGLAVNWVTYVMNRKVFEGLSVADKKALREASRAASAGAMVPLIAAQAAAGAKLREQGASIYSLNDAEKKAFLESTRVVHEEIRKVVGEPGQKLLGIMAKYR
jgi:TRAP-type C4-dicarboxylate transport system substrate-binding protein